jgi:hypothetical protein
MYIALSNKLLREFFNYKMGKKFDKKIILHLFKYLQPFSITKEQLKALNLDIAIQQNIISGGDIISPSNAKDEKELIASTIYQIMLTDDKDSYPYINILKDEVNTNYTASYTKGESRQKAKAHIKKLLQNARYINIVDSYLYENWRENFKLLKDILPLGKSIVIYAKFERYLSAKDKEKLRELKALKLRIKNYTQKDSNESGLDMRNIHDRYIITDKIVIVLSGGLNYLVDTSKDFTYVVKEK